MKQTLLLLAALLIMVKSNCQEDKIFLSAPYNYSDWIGGGDRYSAASLNSSKFVVAYDKGGVWEGKVRVGNIARDSTISFGNEYTFSTEMTLNGVEIDALSPTEFLLTYRDSYTITIRKGKVTGNSIILYTPHICLIGYCYTFSVAATSSSAFIISFVDPESDRGKAAMGKITDNQVSMDSAYTFSLSSIENYAEMSMDTLSKSRFVIAYGYSGGRAVIGNISQTGEISFGNVYYFNGSGIDTYSPRVRSIDENQFVIGFIHDYYLQNGALIMGAVSNQNEISFGAKFICSPNRTASMSLITLTRDKIILAYQLRNATPSSLVNSADIKSDNTFQLNNATINDSGSGLTVITKMDNSSFVLLYQREDDFDGIAKIGSTKKFGSASTSDFLKESNISVYPNPASQFLHIGLGSIKHGAEIQLVDVSGQVLFREFCDSSLITLNIGNLGQGVYFVNIIMNDHKVTKKLIKI